MMDLAELGALMAAPVPDVSVQDAALLAQRYFGISGEISLLNGERDRNFRLRDGQGGDYVLKISNAAEDPAVIGFQTAALHHLAQYGADLPVPRLVPSLGGGSAQVALRLGQAGFHIVRVFDFMAGTPFQEVAVSPKLLFDLGCRMAQIGLALRDFADPASQHDFLWDIKHAPRTRPLLVHIADPAQRRIVADILDHFAAEVAPALARLRAQVIHNDMSPYNILVDQGDPTRVAGILDFGDLVHSPLINDLAVAASYQLSDHGHPLGGAAPLIAGYHATVPLLSEEADILYDLIAARLAMRVTIAGWRADMQPENRTYILRYDRQCWAALLHFITWSRDEARIHIRNICGLETRS